MTGHGDFWTTDQWADWSNELAHLIPDEDMLAFSNPDGAQEGIVLDVLRAYASERQSIWTEVADERARAHAKHGDKSMEAWSADNLTRLSILLEEVGEVAKEFNDALIEGRAPDLQAIRAELVQVSAMSGAWADAIPRGAEPSSRCPRCGHQPHQRMGFCPNLASDNDCSCTYVRDEGR